MVPLGNVEMGNLVLDRECWGVYICTNGFLSLYTTCLTFAEPYKIFDFC